MRVAFDARCLNRTHVRGMGKYLWNVLERMPREAGTEWLLLGDRPDLPTHFPPLEGLRGEIFDQRGFRFHAWEQYGVPARLRRRPVDLLHATSTTLPWWQPVPTVVTIHDTIPWDSASERSDSFFWNRLLPSAYRKCAAIITISESSRRDICRLWPEVSSKLHVIPHGVESSYLEVEPGPLSAGLRESGIDSPYLLYVGGGIARKRLDWALRVWQGTGRPDVQLVVLGLEAGSHERVGESLPLEWRSRICFPSFVPESEMPRLYQNASAVLYPTLYEGFGLPALEAQAVGTPVLFSAVGSLAELEGPGAIVLPTEDLDAWVRCTGELIERRGGGAAPLGESRSWAVRFCWEESARRHRDLYESVALGSEGTRSSVVREMAVQ